MHMNHILMATLTLVPTPQDSVPPTDIDGLMAGLSAEDAGERDRAQARLLALADDIARALQALEGAMNSRDLEVRTRAARIHRSVVDRLRALSAGASVSKSIRAFRERWLKRDFENAEALARESFGDVELVSFHHAPTIEVSDHLESADNEEYQSFKPLSRFGGKRDLMTTDVVEALRTGSGIVLLDGDTVTPFAKDEPLPSAAHCLLVALPDADVCTSYVVIAYRPKSSN